MNMFSENLKQFKPLADRMRPNKIEDFIGQEHIVGKNTLLYKAIKNGNVGSVIFYGPPGTGKTTLANIIANSANADFVKLNAVSSGVGETKDIIKRAKDDLAMYGKRTYFLLDECHRWNKAQSDSVLAAIEDGSIIFIGSTTENPYINMTRAIISRCRVYELKNLTEKEIELAIKRAINDKENGYGNFNIEINDKALSKLALLSNGDVRTALNSLEFAISSSKKKDDIFVIDEKIIAESVQKNGLALNEDAMFDILSAFCKSLRGSDAEAALYYSQRLLQAGCDPLLIARRLVAHASEDIGMADSNAILIANAALNAVKNVGVPECILSLSHAIIYLCEAPKSNSVLLALKKAEQLANENGNLKVPNALKNHKSLNNDGSGKYKYPHDFGGYVYQQYLPNEIKDEIFYEPSKNGKEKNLERKKVFK